MAYAALSSLVHTIRGILFCSRVSIATSTHKNLRSARGHAISLKDTLERCSEGVTAFDEEIIIEEARKLEDAIELFPLSMLHCESGEEFDHLRQDVDRFSEAAKEREKNIKELFSQKTEKSPEEEEEEEEEEEVEEEVFSEDVSLMVGLSDQFLQIRDKLITSVRKNKVRDLEMFVWISGMAGIGKTALAKRIFNDPSIKANFKCRAFVTVGKEFRLEKVSRVITAQLNLDNKKMFMEGDKDIHESFCRILNVRKSLIVLDDMWEERNFLEPLPQFIEEYSGTRILVTSRIDGSYNYFLKLKMRFLDEKESWELLRRNVFGDSECPPQLEKAGKKIAEKCEGLPLLIITVAPILLSKAQKNAEDWNRVAEKPRLVLEDASHQISEVLLSSYNQIDEREKLCFLYIAAFPQTYKVRRSTITNLWCVEGFIDDIQIFWFLSFTTLVERNLVVGHHTCWSTQGTKACSLHCAYWYVSRRVAENNKFLYTIDSDAVVLDERVKSHHGLAIYENVLFAIKEVHDTIASISTVRSLLCTGPYHQYQVPVCFELRLLRVLSALTIRFYEFPIEVVKLIRLRYLSLTCNANLPPSISKLWNLEFLIVHQHLSIKRVAANQSYVPVEIWELQELKHLEIMGRNLPSPAHPGVVLPNLIKLLGVGVESCTKGVLESLPNLKKSRIQIELAPNARAAQTMSCFDHIFCLHKLYSFQIVIMNPTLVLPPPPPLSFSSSSLEKLTFSGFGYSWKDMTKVAKLPKLEVLKLQCYAFRGEKWEVKDMRFPWLHYLSIEDTDLVEWTSCKHETFPRLLRLRLKNCYKLHEIPELVSLMRIELFDCNPIAVTCSKEKHPELYWVRDRYYDTEMVTASYSWK